MEEPTPSVPIFSKVLTTALSKGGSKGRALMTNPMFAGLKHSDLSIEDGLNIELGRMIKKSSSKNESDNDGQKLDRRRLKSFDSFGPKEKIGKGGNKSKTGPQKKRDSSVPPPPRNTDRKESIVSPPPPTTATTSRKESIVPPPPLNAPIIVVPPPPRNSKNL